MSLLFLLKVRDTLGHIDEGVRIRPAVQKLQLVAVGALASQQEALAVEGARTTVQVLSLVSVGWRAFEFKRLRRRLLGWLQDDAARRLSADRLREERILVLLAAGGGIMPVQEGHGVVEKLPQLLGGLVFGRERRGFLVAVQSLIDDRQAKFVGDADSRQRVSVAALAQLQDPAVHGQIERVRIFLGDLAERV